MSTSQQDAVTYFQDQADVLVKQTGSKSSSVRAGALLRVRKRLPHFREMSDADVARTLRKSDALEVIAMEQNSVGWRAFRATLVNDEVAEEDHGVPDDGRMKSMRFSFGDSTVGSVGAAVSVSATNVEQALELLEEAFPTESYVDPGLIDAHPEYVGDAVVYFNPSAVTAGDLVDWEYTDEDPDDDDDSGDDDPVTGEDTLDAGQAPAVDWCDSNDCERPECHRCFPQVGCPEHEGCELHGRFAGVEESTLQADIITTHPDAPQATFDVVALRLAKELDGYPLFVVSPETIALESMLKDPRSQRGIAREALGPLVRAAAAQEVTVGNRKGHGLQGAARKWLRATASR